MAEWTERREGLPNLFTGQPGTGTLPPAAGGLSGLTLESPLQRMLHSPTDQLLGPPALRPPASFLAPDPCVLPGTQPARPQAELRAWNPPETRRAEPPPPPPPQAPGPAPGGQNDPNAQPYHLPSREEIMANPDRFGRPFGSSMSPEQFASQYFREFVAHNVAYMRPFQTDAQGGIRRDERGQPISAYRPEVQAFLHDFGYQSQPAESDVVNNPSSGLYAMRLNPLAPQPGQSTPTPPPLVAFRGTEGPDAPDWAANMGGQVGRRQMDDNAADIARLMRVEDGQRLALTGHSLGGADAQIATSRFPDRVESLTTFQSPGIYGSEARRVDRSNRDGHIDVNHYRANGDIVPFAGEQMVGGNIFQFNAPPRNGGWANAVVPQLNTGTEHVSHLLMADQPSYIGRQTDGPVQVTQHDSDPYWGRRGTESVRQTLGVPGRMALDAYNGRLPNWGDVADVPNSLLRGAGNAARYTLIDTPWAALNGAGSLINNAIYGRPPAPHIPVPPPPAVLMNPPQAAH